MHTSYKQTHIIHTCQMTPTAILKDQKQTMCIDWITIFTKDEGEAGGGSRDRPEELDDDAYT